MTRARIGFLGAALVALAVVLAACGGPSGEFSQVDANQALDLVESAPEGLVVLDIRTPEEYQAGHIEGSVLVDFYSADFREQLDGLDKDTPYLVYCRSGNRSGQTIPVMKDLRFSEVYELREGVNSWASQGLPLATG